MAQAPMRADEAITSTRPNAIRFPRRSRETLARRRAYPQSDGTGEDIESPTRPLRLGPWLGRGEVFRGRVDRLDHPEIKTRHIESCAFSLPTKANTKRAAMVSKRAATPNRPTCTEGLETLIMLAFSLFSRFCQGCSAGTDERFFQSLAS